MKPVFLTHDRIFAGDFSIIERTHENEANEGFHYHDFYDAHLFFCDDSQQVIGNILLGETEYEVRNGDLLLVRIFEAHQFRMNPHIQYRRYCISINSPLMLYICSEKTNLLSIFNGENPNYPYKHLSEDEQQQFLMIYRIFKNSLGHLKHGRSLLELASLTSMLAILYNSCFADIVISKTEASHATALNTLVHYIEDHLSENLSLEHLSKVTNFSSYYLCHLFKKYTNTTLNKYIMAKRIGTAKKMLMDSDLSLQSISRDLGFNNYNHFFRCFRQLEGISPSEYQLKVKRLKAQDV